MTIDKGNAMYNFAQEKNFISTISHRGRTQGSLFDF